MRYFIITTILYFAFFCKPKETSRTYELYKESEPQNSRFVTVRVFDSQLSDIDDSDVCNFVTKYLSIDISRLTIGERINFEEDNYSETYLRLAHSPNYFYVFENFKISKVELIDDENIAVSVDYVSEGEYGTHLIKYTEKRIIKTDFLLVVFENNRWRVRQSFRDFYYTKTDLLKYLKEVGKYNFKYLKLFQILEKEWNKKSLIQKF